MYDATHYPALVRVKIYDPKLRNVREGGFGDENPLATLVINQNLLEGVLESLHNSGHTANGSSIVDLLRSEIFTTTFNPKDKIKIDTPTGIAAASHMYSATPDSNGFKPNPFIAYGDTVVEAIASLCYRLDAHQIERIDSLG